jgi:hypothetical protein
VAHYPGTLRSWEACQVAGRFRASTQGSSELSAGTNHLAPRTPVQLPDQMLDVRLVQGQVSYLGSA